MEKFQICSRQKAQALIMRGDVLLGTRVLTKPGYQLKEQDVEHLILKQIDPYVGFGAHKLLRALEVFELEDFFHNQVILDIGASTGGFTQILLEKGARCVYATDVGENQLDYRLRNDPRVICYEKTDARKLDVSHFSEGKPDFFVVDVSFISLKHIFPVLKRLEIFQGIVLIKPQFEIGREVERFRGIVKNPEDLQKAIEKVREYAQDSGFRIEKTTPSPMQRANKNQEFLSLVVGDAEFPFTEKKSPL